VITPASLTAFEVLVKPFHDGHVVVHFVARFVAQYREKSEVAGVIRVKIVVISIAYPDREPEKWCPHTDSNRGPPDYKMRQTGFVGFPQLT